MGGLAGIVQAAMKAAGAAGVVNPAVYLRVVPGTKDPATLQRAPDQVTPHPLARCTITGTARKDLDLVLRGALDIGFAAAELPFEPSATDRVKVGAVTYDVKVMDPVRAGGAPVWWTLTVTRGASS
jgi:hypothetical protein